MSHLSHSDTSRETEAVLIERLRGLSVARKLAMVVQLCEAVAGLAAAGVRRRYPNASDEEVRLRTAALRYDRATMVAAFGWDPDERGY